MNNIIFIVAILAGLLQGLTGFGAGIAKLFPYFEKFSYDWSYYPFSLCRYDN